MAHLIFFEKPSCGGNARQRALLEAAGHTLTRRNLLDTPWTGEELLAFLQPLPVSQWFNRSAPRVKSGELQPDLLDAETAIRALLAEPLLIRRPLMQRDDGARMVGFDAAEVERFVGLGATSLTPSSMEGCAADLGAGRCSARERTPQRRQAPSRGESGSRPYDGLISVTAKRKEAR